MLTLIVPRSTTEFGSLLWTTLQALEHPYELIPGTKTYQVVYWKQCGTPEEKHHGAIWEAWLHLQRQYELLCTLKEKTH